MQQTAETAFDKSLCSACKGIPFSELEEYWFPREPPELINEKRQQKERFEWRINRDFLNRTSTCSLCRLFASCCPNGLHGASAWSETRGSFDDGLPSGPFLRIRVRDSPLRPETPRLVIYYRPEPEPVRYPPRGQRVIQRVPRHLRELNHGDATIVPLTSNLLGSGNHEFKTFRIDPETADFERISTWLQVCGSKHRCVKVSGSLQCVNGTRFIDCVERSIIRIDDTKASPSINYIALSYVWGSSTTIIRGNPPPDGGTLPDLLPNVIEDAIIAVQKLGLRYLWVDQYCIDQSDHDGKTEQIRSMDKIYQNAWATIVACAGLDCEYGLPGIGKRPRFEQLSAKTPDDKMLLISTLPPLSTAIQKSVWATRGWTYQEAVLSKRLIFFTDYQVYAICSESGGQFWCESLELLPQSTPPPTEAEESPPPDMDPNFLFGGEVPSQPLNRIFHHLRAYTARQLTFEADALNAISGVLVRSNLYSYTGLPFLSVAADLEATARNFVKALCWQGEIYKSNLVRRYGFPSWSWAGWKGRTYCSTKAIDRSNLDREVHHVKIWIELSDQKTISFCDFLRDRQTTTTTVLRGPSPFIHLDSVILKLKIQPRDFLGYHGPPAFEPWICHCHPTEGHPAITSALEGVKMFEKSGVNFLEEGKKELLNNPHLFWECVLLYEYQREQQLYPTTLNSSLFVFELLVLEIEKKEGEEESNGGEPMTRVGSASIQTESREWFDDLCAKGERRRVRLG